MLTKMLTSLSKRYHKTKQTNMLTIEDFEFHNIRDLSHY